MIIGKLNDLSHYKGLSKNLDTAIDFLLHQDLSNLPLGKTIIDENKVFINRFEYYGEELDSCLIEAHQKYIDIHLVLEGAEYLGYSHIINLTPVGSYNEETGFIEYEGAIFIQIPCYKGSFILTLPEDTHMPKIKLNHELIKKAVCKVKVD